MSSVCQALRAGFLAVLLAPGGVAATQPVKRPEPPPRDEALVPCTTDEGLSYYVPRLLSVTVNGSRQREPYVFLQRPCGALLARVADLEAMRIRTAGKPTVEINEEAYLNLNSFDRLTYTLAIREQALRIEGHPSVFYPTVIDFEPPPGPEPADSGPGAYLNYGAYLSGPLGAGDRTLNANAGLGVFGWSSVLNSDWFGFRRGDEQSVFRVGTTFTRDFVDSISTLRVGDIRAHGGAFGAAAPVGGVQYGTNFTTRPRMRTTPVAMMEAATRRWANVGLFNDDLLDGERGPRAAFMNNLATVSYGPVELANMPTYNNGVYELVLRDSLGGEVTVRQPYFFNRGLLRKGLDDFSFEGGLLRRDIAGRDYEGAFGAATWRRGLTNTVTAEGHVEGSNDGAALGASASWAVPYVGVLTGTGAASRHDLVEGAGSYGALGLENRYRRFAYALRGDCQSREFLLASADSVPIPKTACRTFANVTGSLPNDDTVGLSVSAVTFAGQDAVRSVELQYGIRPFAGAQLQTFAGWTDRADGNWTAGLTFVYSFAALARPAATRPPGLFDPRHATGTLTAFASENGEETAFAQVASHARLAGGDASVQAGSSLVGVERQAVSAGWTGPKLIAAGGVFRQQEFETFNAGASSALIWFDDAVFASRPLVGSFAVVRMGGENAGVRVNNVPADSDGDAVVGPVIAYYPNLLRVNLSDLAPDARLPQSQFQAVPRYRSGVVVRPGIERVQGAILVVQVLDEKGRRHPLPLGSSATVAGREEPFPVGEDGEIYVEGLADTTTVVLRYNLQECAIEVSLPAGLPGGIPELGPYLCESIRP